MATATAPAEGQRSDRDDRRVMARAASGDEAAWAELYDRHAAGLVAFASQYVGDRSAAEDIVQATFLACYRTLAAGTEIEHPRAWLYRVARNTALTALRARGPARAGAELREELQARAAAASDEAARRESLREVVDDIVALPADQRAALTLFELGGMSQSRVAEVLEVDPAKVKALVFQARTALVAEREARDASCESVREKLASLRGGALNQRLIRHHLRRCAPCTAYREELRDRRRAFVLLLPVVPGEGLREAILGAVGAGGATAAAAKTSAVAGGALLAGRAAGRTRWLAGGSTTAAATAAVVVAVGALGGDPPAPVSDVLRPPPAEAADQQPTLTAEPARRSRRPRTRPRPVVGALRRASVRKGAPAPAAGSPAPVQPRSDPVPAGPPAKPPAPAPHDAPPPPAATPAPAASPAPAARPPAAAPTPAPAGTPAPTPASTPQPAPASEPPCPSPNASPTGQEHGGEHCRGQGGEHRP